MQSVEVTHVGLRRVVVSFWRAAPARRRRRDHEGSVTPSVGGASRPPFLPGPRLSLIHPPAGTLQINRAEGGVMKNMRQLIPITGLLLTMAGAVYMVVQLNGQEPQQTGNFTNAAAAEVRDAQGQVLLRGPFVQVEEDDDDIERKATLEPTGVDADAAGDAEVEFSKAATASQEVEFSVRNLPPGAAFTFVIDGVEIATATTDRRGRAEVELDVRMPGSAASR
jgi:hypothetical protein